ncbi:histone-fold-containing protein [Crassisporium funariophilum]|nr:histone-fold-containing protein [Crassisporium funariophilum]
MPRKDTYSGPISAQAQQELVSEGIENFELPKSVVMKIAKSSIPENVKLQKETVLSLVKGSTVFINYLAATAHDVALSKQHKSISASDVLKALELMEFSDMVNKLQGELQIYRELSKTDKSKKGGSTSHSASTSKAAAKPATLPVMPSGPGALVPESASTARGKGKETSTVPTTAPFTSAPLDLSHSAEESISGMGEPMDVDEDVPEDVPETEGLENEGEDDDVEEDEDLDDDVVVESDVDDSDGLEDPVALEEEELKKDSRGLEEPRMVVGENDD